MKLVNSSLFYSFSHRYLHWTTALIVLGLLSVGYYMTSLEISETKLRFFMMHKSFGLLVLVLTSIRIVFLFRNPKIAPIASHRAWERFLAKSTHFLLYALLIGMPLSGWIMSSAGQFPISFFGLPVFDLIDKNEKIFVSYRTIHEFGGLIFIGVIGLHMLGALKHHIVDQDNTLFRMIRRDVSWLSALFFVLAFGALWFLSAFMAFNGVINKNEPLKITSLANKEIITRKELALVESPSFSGGKLPLWVIDKNQSYLRFGAKQYGQIFEGNFLFTGLIAFDPRDLKSSKVEIVIDISSINTGSEDRDQQAMAADWFNVEQFPEARFTANVFESLGSNKYIAKGELSIRDITHPLDLPFTLEIEENSFEKVSKMSGEILLNRLDYGVGKGQWSSTEAIANEVKISIFVKATQK